MQLFHGLKAYSGKRSPLETIRQADELIGLHLAAADRPIGSIGVIVNGAVDFVADRDIWSEVTEDGVRIPGDHGWYEYLAGDDLDPHQIESWMKQNRDPNYHGDYCEAFIRPRAITGVWVKPYADKKTRLIARVIANRQNCPVYVVERYTRVWDVVGSYIDPAEKWDEYEIA